MTAAPPPVLMLVDDDEAVLEQAADYLREGGFQVVTAKHGKRAVETLDAGLNPAVIVLDLMMPVMSGWDVWDWLQQSRFANVPVVVWTATGLRQGAVGAARVVGKGEHPKELLEAIRSVIAPTRP